MTHPIPNLSTRAGQIAHYAAVKKRINTAPYKPTVREPIVRIIPVKKSEYWDVPTWKLQRTSFDDHVIRWQMRMVSTPTDWLRDRCKELDMDYSAIIGPARKMSLVRVRQQLIWEASKRFTLSLPQLGRMFGGRDHTTCIHAIRRHEDVLRNANDQ